MSETFNFDPVHQGLRDQTKKGLLFTAGGQAVKSFISLGPIVILSRLLPPSDFGLIAIATSITATLGTVTECGLSAATIQAPKINHSQVSALFWINVGLGISVALVCAGAAPIASHIFKQPELTPVMIVLGLLGVIGSLSVQHDALLRRKLEFQKIVTRDLIAQVMGVIAGISAAWAGLGIWALVLMQGVAVSVSAVSLWIACSWRPSAPKTLAPAKPFVQFGMKVLGEKVLTQATRGMDTMVIGYFHGNAAVGHYSRAQGLLNKPMNQALAPLNSVLRPVLARAAESKERLLRVTSELLSIISLVSAFVVATLMPASPGVVRILLGDAWGDTIPIFAALTIFALVEPCASLVGSIVIASGRPGALLKWRIFSVSLILGGLFLSAPYGTVAMAYTFALVGLLIRTPLFLWYASRITPLRFGAMLMAILPSVAVAVVTVVVATVVRDRWFAGQNVYETIATIAVSCLCYVLLCLVFKTTRATAFNVWEQGITMIRKKKTAKKRE